MILFGAVLYAVLVGTISSFSFGLDSSGRKYKEKLDEVNEYMQYIKLNEEMRQKVFQYFELKYKGKYFNEENILGEMNESLKRDIAIHNSKDLIAKVPFLRRELNDGRDNVFLGRIAQALKATHFVTDDIIFEQGWVMFHKKKKKKKKNTKLFCNRFRSPH
jgi:predicted nucleic acid-binding protein